jgi:hypothetical protein
MLTTQKSSLKKRRKKARIRAIVITLTLVLLAALAGGAYYYFFKVKPEKDKEQESSSAGESTQAVQTVTQTPEETGSEPVVVIDDMTTAPAQETSATLPSFSDDEVLGQAQRYGAMYDYDTAIALMESALAEGENEEYEEAITTFQEEKSKLVKWADNTTIPHIFFHTLVNDTALAFDGDYDSGNYNQVMTTVDEFNAIMQEMYDRGYVLVSIYDIAKPVTAEDGTVTLQKQEIYLPEGKTPFVLSQDDVSYYEYMEDDGFPNRLVVQEDGTVTCEIDQDDGTTIRGSYDLIPLLEDFIALHPDFSYKGARGTIALTGYEGVFGYRTSEYNFGADCKEHDSKYDPNPNIEQDRETAKQVADALKSMGWTFATHGWGHKAMGNADYDSFVADIDRWMEEVVPIIGATDIVIYPNGDDIGSWRYYTDENQSEDAKAKYNYLESLGFKYFCNVDGSKEYWVQISSDFVRMGRRNLDGTRMYEAVVGYRDLLSDLFDANEVFDPARPTPVEGVPIPTTEGES